jgi:two-component system, chemotaxis family, protein-glutamate methylesterase/glutaminase
MTATPGRDIVVVAASAGGVEALRGLLSQLPAGLPATLLVVLHVPAAGGRVLPRILGRAGLLPARAAIDGEPLLPGHVFVAPPDHHMLLVGEKIRLSQGPRHNGHRPAADPLFISAALSGGPRTLAVVLSGTLDDGAAGAAAVERRGGVVAIQDPGESAYDGMPRAAIAATHEAKVLRLPEIAAFLEQESGTPLAKQTIPPDPGLDRQLSAFLAPVPRSAAEPSEWSGVTCPECGGPLRQEDRPVPVRFECQAGHGWSPESLVAAQAAGIERALWAAVLRLEERSRLSQVLAETAEGRGYPISASGFLASSLAARSAARQIRKLLESANAVEITRAPGEGAS